MVHPMRLIALCLTLVCPACLSSVLDGLPGALPADPAITMELDGIEAFARTLPPGPLRLELGGVDGAPPFLAQDLLRAVRERAGEAFLFYDRPGSGARVRLQIFVAGEWGNAISGTQVGLRTRWELRDTAERPLWRMEGYETCQGKRVQNTTRCALDKIAGRVLPELIDFLTKGLARPDEPVAEPKRMGTPEDKLGGDEK